MDKIKPLLEELGIEPNDSWEINHCFIPGKLDTCYYYTFLHKGITYCCSNDSYSFIFSSELSINPIYAGYNIKTFKKAILKVIKK